MSNEVKKYKVSIFGETYTLVSDETDEQIIAAAHAVDILMREISEKSHLADPKRISILAALQLASQLKMIESEHMRLSSHIDQVFLR